MQKILVTGASGYLGSIIQQSLSGDLITLGRKGANIMCDLSTQVPLIPVVNLVIHAAGKAHAVPKTTEEKQEFFDVNVTGTQNLLKGLEESGCLPKAFVFISSVAVYGLERGISIDENHPLNASDPYGLSKIKAEGIIQNWCKLNKITCTILRLPLLVGANPPGNLGAMIKSIKSGYYFNIAGGQARKSMVLAEDVIKVIPNLAEVGGTFNLTDGHHPSFFELSHHIALQLNKKTILNIPKWMAKIVAAFGDYVQQFPINSNKLTKITSDLTFDDSKARRELGWNPSKVFDHFSIK